MYNVNDINDIEDDPTDMSPKDRYNNLKCIANRQHYVNEQPNFRLYRGRHFEDIRYG